ncbi:hypothetical protein SNOG_03499 [Parastagonospora nodorum SN15]|uniref:Uncharacterized protein n=1 Tax=Phaeosphaeria nodorum (strain SN15 / ATCC MYA-4574 / FGSC 10173) TaxID=321614 RepID=Q0UXL5_PHANO|nr:hypothetical protein SNOG_03499 [Parastagonospora nodorum SN15]EAT88704.1 hypothetical protein SNOG_03499 [Parastagonospora nodorum SN15]
MPITVVPIRLHMRQLIGTAAAIPPGAEQALPGSLYVPMSDVTMVIDHNDGANDVLFAYLDPGEAKCQCQRRYVTLTAAGSVLPTARAWSFDSRWVRYSVSRTLELLHRVPCSLHTIRGIVYFAFSMVLSRATVPQL